MPQKTYREAIQEALAEELRRDPAVLLLGAAPGSGAAPGIDTAPMQAEFGDQRVLAAPQAELGLTGAGVGAAATGLRPVVDLHDATALYLACQQLINQAAAMRYRSGGQAILPLVFLARNGTSSHAEHQHGQPVHPLLMQVPLLKTIMPATPYDARGLLKAAIRDNNPVVFLYHQALAETTSDVPDEDYVLPIGQGTVKRPGNDVTICAAGLMVHYALQAAEQLANENIAVEVLDLRTLAPWDEHLVLESVARTGHFVAVDESYPLAGAASEWVATVAEKGFHHLKSRPVRVSNQPVPVPFSPPLKQAAIPSVREIVLAVQHVYAASGNIAYEGGSSS